MQDIDLYLPCGKTLALVGSSGAGKSTIADLLPRFYDPITGAITIDDIDLREFDIQSLRKAMGIVSQDTFLFNDSIKNNIAYGEPEATEAEIITAAKKANAYEFVNQLPQGFDTIIGDRGVMLSGGQRQRLAIARALLQDPEILILDEATSALDTVSERLVQEAIDNLSRGSLASGETRTTLVIAHRLSTVQKADQIAVLDRGRVVEVGTHTELLQKGAYYSRLYSMQFGKDNGEGHKTKLIPKIASKLQKELIHIAHEIRNPLNSIIDSLNLLLDNMGDNPQEWLGLIEKSSLSAKKMSYGIDHFENFVSSQSNDELLSVAEANKTLTIQHQGLSNICDEFHTNLHPCLCSLHSLVDNLSSISEQEKKIIKNAYKYDLYLLDYLMKFKS